MTRLDDSQRKLVEDHLYLVRYVIFKRLWFLLDQNDVDDYIQIGSIGLCKAAVGYNPDSGCTFKTFAFRCIRNEIGMERRRLSYLKNQREAERLDASIPDVEVNSICSLIPDKETMESAYRFTLLRQAIEKLPPKQRRIVKRYIAGYTQQEIGNAENISQSYTSRMIRMFRQRVLEENIS